MRPLVPVFLLFFGLFCLTSGGVATAHVALTDCVACKVQGYVFAPDGASPVRSAQSVQNGPVPSNHVALTAPSLLRPDAVYALSLGYGMLRVYSDPAVPTTVFVNNVPMDDWGLNWVKLAPGTYTIHFSDVPGFASPVNQTVTVTDGATTTVTGTFQQLGYLHVTTNPALPATISIDGKVRDDWGVSLPLAPGLHTVHFGDVAGYATPADQQVNVVAGSTVTVTGDYVVGVNAGPSGFGYLRVVTDPAVVSTIYVNNVPMDDWGLNWVKLAPGTYTIHFSDVPGFASPVNQTVTVTDGATTTVTGTFQQLGYLHVTTNPAVAGTIYVNGAAMDDWGAWVAIQPGSYTVSFGDVAGYAKPADQVVAITAGSTTTIVGQYKVSFVVFVVIALASVGTLAFSSFVVYRVVRKRRAGAISLVPPTTPAAVEAPPVKMRAPEEEEYSSERLASIIEIEHDDAAKVRRCYRLAQGLVSQELQEIPRETETHWEYFHRVARKVPNVEDSFKRLSELFELAEYSQTPMGRAQSEEAMKLLLRLREEIGGQNKPEYGNEYRA